MMEAVELVALLLALVVVSLALIFRRSSERTRQQLQPTVRVRDPAVARHALIGQADWFSNRPVTPFPVPLMTGRRRHGHGMTTVPYGPHWRALRSNLTASILQPWRQGLLAPIRREAVAGLVADLATRREDDVVAVRDVVYMRVFSMLARVCFGYDGVDEARVRSIATMMHEFRLAIREVQVLARSTLAKKLVHWKLWRRFVSFRSRQTALFVPLIEAARRRRRSPAAGTNGGDVRRAYVDSLVDVRVPDDAKRGLTDDEMVSLAVEFFSGAESIVASVEWTLAHLVDHPDVQKKLRQEIVDHGSGDGRSASHEHDRPGRLPYLHAVVLESLRLHPPFPVVMRDVRTEGATIGTEATVPAGGNGLRVQFVLGDIAKAGWTDPHEFRPERFLAGGEGEGVGLVPSGAKEIKMMPFGAGHRACPGAPLGVLYIESFLAALVRDFEWSLVPDGGGVDMTELYGFITVMKSPLKARIAPVRAPVRNEF